MWNIKIYDSYLICGTVDGKLLLLDKSSLSVTNKTVFGKKNIGSLYTDGKTLYAASHDGKLFKIETSMTKVHKKMFVCAGIYEDISDTFTYFLQF